MFTVELGLLNSNPIDSALTVYRIQKQWSRNPETVISEFGADCRRGCVPDLGHVSVLNDPARG